MCDDTQITHIRPWNGNPGEPPAPGFGYEFATVTGTVQNMLDDFYGIGGDNYETLRQITAANWNSSRQAITDATAVCGQGWPGQIGRKLLVTPRSDLGKLRVRAAIRGFSVFTTFGIAYGASALIAKSDPRTASAFGAGSAGLAIAAYVFYDIEAWINDTGDLNVVKSVLICR